MEFRAWPVDHASFGCSNCGRVTTRAPARWSLPAGCPRSLRTCWPACAWKPSGQPATCRSSSPRPCCSWWPPCSPALTSPSEVVRTPPWIQVALNSSPQPLLACLFTASLRFFSSVKILKHFWDMYPPSSALGPKVFLNQPLSSLNKIERALICVLPSSLPATQPSFFASQRPLKWHLLVQ